MAKRGPNTAAGKAVSMLNATRHGILSEAPIIRDAESEEDWERHLQGMIDSLQPEGHGACPEPVEGRLCSSSASLSCSGVASASPAEPVLSVVEGKRR